MSGRPSRPPHTPRVPSRHRRTVATVSAAALGAVVLGAAPSAAAPRDGTREVVRQGLERLVREEGFPAALASVHTRGGRQVDLAAGTGDLRTGRRAPVDGQVRAGSNTKAFTAVVVLQLVGEGRIGLDEPVETYLPGLVRGDGIDGRAITVRQLLQHTSGLPDYVRVLGTDWFAGRDTYREPRDLLDMALTLPADFAPGQGWRYSNTGYLLAGMIVQRVTGRPFEEQVDERVVERLGLEDTYLPAPGERAIRGRHVRGYHSAEPGGELRDITELDASWAWAAGGLVSTPRDLDRFFSALLAGDLLAPAELAQMRTTVEAPGMWPGARYGLGLISTPLTCGGLLWGHGGDIPGYETRGGATEDGRAVTVAVTALPGALAEPQAAADAVLELVDAAVCA
ncbi:serine hydrolase domain-containing protein [Kineococcus sp. NUM-3379]